MIIKNLTLKTGNVRPLIRYLFKYTLSKDKQIDYHNSELFVHRHNLRSRSIEGYVKEWNENRSRRINRRKNEVIANHVILSWHNDDANKISNTMLRAMAKEFVRLRGEDSIFLFSKHTDRRHVHLHCIHSSSNLSGTSNRVSKEAFMRIKVQMDSYQKLHYPELINSLPFHGREKNGKTRIQSFPQCQSGRIAEKEQLKDLVAEVFKNSRSIQYFTNHLHEQGYQTYQRGGKLTGIQVKNGRKYRFRIIGLSEDKLEKLNRQSALEEEYLAEFAKIRKRASSKEIIHQKDNRIRMRDEDHLSAGFCDDLPDVQKRNATPTFSTHFGFEECDGFQGTRNTQEDDTSEVLQSCFTNYKHELL